MKTKTFFKWLCCSAILLIASVQPAWATTYTFCYQKDMPPSWYEASNSQTMTQSSAYNKRYYCTISLDASSSYGIYVKEDGAFYKNNTTTESNQKVQLYKYDNNNANRVTFKSGNSGTYIFTYDADTKELFVSPQSSQTIVMYYVNTGGGSSYDSYYCLDNSLSLTQEGTSAKYSGIVNLTSAKKHYMYVKIGSDLYWRGKTTLSVGSSTQLYFYKKGGTCGDSGDKINFTPSSSGKYKFTWNHLDKTMKMERVYTITYNLNGGSGADTPSAQDVVSGNNVTLADKPSGLTKTGYDFVGWNTKADGTGANTYNPGATIGPIQTNYTMYAKWTPQVYTITYKDQGGADFSGDNAGDLPSTHTYGTATALVDASRAGYRFDGWFENSACTGSAITEIGATAKTADFTLYAKWTEDKVYYDVTSGVKSFAGTTEQQTSKADLSISATFGEYNSSTNKVLASSILKFTVSNIATGYAIEGWYSNAACSAKIAGTGTSDTYTTPAVDGDVSVYVKILATQYNITYNDVYGTNPNPSSYNVEDEITFLPITDYRTGYEFTSWSPASITKGTTGAQTVTAQWTAKTYTISFNQNGGEGGQTGTVTATYDQPMPGTVTRPTRVGYKFNGYYTATSGGKKYYNANGTSANNWDKDANTTLYAQWTQLYCFIEGRFHIATDKTRTSWTNTFNSGDWDVNSTKIRFTWNETKKRYELATNATLKDLSGEISGYNPDFFIKQSTSSSSLQNVKSYNHDGTLSSEEGVKNAMNAADNKYCKFNSQDRSGYVTICFDEKDIWFELETVTLYDVTVQSFNGGSVDPSGTHKIGEISWTITANASDGYHFNRWTTTGGASVENATSASTKVTATANGTVTANFAANTNLYFQKPGKWSGSEVWVYFDPYWKDDTNGAGVKNRAKGKQMTHLNNGTFVLTYSGSEAHSAIAFVNGNQDDYDPFDQTSVSYLGNFDHCSANNWFIPDDNPSKYLNKHKVDGKDVQTAYYNGYWTSYYDRVEYYFMNSISSPKWTQLEEYRFKNTDDHNVKRLEIKNVTEGKDIAFRVWQTCDCWFGVGADDCVIQKDTKNYGLGTGEKNVTLHAWKTGSYELIYHTNSNQLDVTYLGDITVANFPGEVSTFVNRQHKIKPDVTLRNGTAVTDVTILVNGHGLPWESSYATYEQNGTNLVITGKVIGSETVTVTYKNTKPIPYVVERTLKVNVATPIVIQAKLTDGDTHWTKTGLVHIHFWGSSAETAQDLTMSYNEDTKLFSVTAPMITDPFHFMFWYGEDINSCANEAWRKTSNINASQSTCYTIDKTTSTSTARTATPGFGLCSADEYYVEITMKNGNTYKSNTIDNLDKEVSFFAPMDNDDTYMGGTIRIVHNGAVSNPITGFAAAGVYVAQIANASGFVANSIQPYTGNYYIRTDGAHGAWGDYKTDPDNLMTSFTPRAEKGETYSYYWMKNVAKTGVSSGDKTNVKADVANDYNDNLAGMIENDKFTDGGGFVYNSANGANVRFSYEPTTNEFKRAILGGAGNNNFLNVYSKNGNLYADKEHQKQLSESADLNDSKFSDLSDWVYEKQVHVAADGKIASKVILKSVFNGQTTHLLGYQINPETGEDTDVPNELEIMGSQSNGDYALRITYDFKKNRLIASWEPGEMEIKADQVIDSDVLFVQKEGADGTIDNTNVAQITYADDAHNAKLTSLKNMIYVLEVTDKVIAGTDKDNQLYWICLPFDCRISDIFGVEGYVTLNAAGQATDGLWGIQRYDGTTRAQHGWFKEDNPEGFWRWMKRDETMKAGTGYVVVFDKTNASSWPSIDVEEVCEGETDGCKGGKKTVQKRLKRLYFPSIGSKFTISYSGDGENKVEYANEPCNVTKPYNRSQYDGNWKVIGPVSYNNIGVDVNTQPNLTFYYTYDQSAAQGHRYSEQQAITGSEEFKSFHSYMTQFGGTLTWKPFTKSEDVTLKAPLYTENSEFQGGLLTIELNDAQGKELNHTFINLSKNGTTGFDQNLDLTKITENCAQIASVSEDVLYAGNTLPLDIEMVPLNVKVVANGTYDIALEQSLEGLEVRLYDAFEQTTTPLDLMPATVTLNKGEYKDRFFLQFVQKSPLTPTNFNGAIEQFNLPTDKTQKLLINDNIYLINGGRIYNVLGVGE